LAVAADGAEIQTIEGLAGPDGTLDPLQEAFMEQGAFQCGFCTPGMIIMGKDLLRKNPAPTERDVRRHIRGNICRCTGYHNIVRAIMSCSAG
jgi:carbon-monoxide dehydrogenase small subunit